MPGPQTSTPAKKSSVDRLVKLAGGSKQPAPKPFLTVTDDKTGESFDIEYTEGREPNDAQISQIIRQMRQPAPTASKPAPVATPDPVLQTVDGRDYASLSPAEQARITPPRRAEEAPAVAAGVRNIADVATEDLTGAALAARTQQIGTRPGKPWEQMTNDERAQSAMFAASPIAQTQAVPPPADPYAGNSIQPAAPAKFDAEGRPVDAQGSPIKSGIGADYDDQGNFRPLFSRPEFQNLGAGEKLRALWDFAKARLSDPTPPTEGKPAFTYPGLEVAGKVLASPVNAAQGLAASGIAANQAREVSPDDPQTTLGQVLPVLGDVFSEPATRGRAAASAVVGDTGAQDVGNVVPELDPNTPAGAVYNFLIRAGADPLNFVGAGAAQEAITAAKTARAAKSVGAVALDTLPDDVARLAGRGAVNAEGRVTAERADRFRVKLRSVEELAQAEAKAAPPTPSIKEQLQDVEELARTETAAAKPVAEPVAPVAKTKPQPLAPDLLDEEAERMLDAYFKGDGPDRDKVLSDYFSGKKPKAPGTYRGRVPEDVKAAHRAEQARISAGSAPSAPVDAALPPTLPTTPPTKLTLSRADNVNLQELNRLREVRGEGPIGKATWARLSADRRATTLEAERAAAPKPKPAPTPEKATAGAPATPTAPIKKEAPVTIPQTPTPVRTPAKPASPMKASAATKRSNIERLVRLAGKFGEKEAAVATSEVKPAAPMQASNARPRRTLPEVEKARQTRASSTERLLKLARKTAEEASSLPRTLQTTADLSATLKQGLVLSVTRPKQAGRAYAQGIKAVFSEAAEKQIAKELEAHPNRATWDKHKLYRSEAGGKVSGREEVFQSNLAEKIPFVKHVVKGSERGYTTTLNTLRTGTFDTTVAAWTRAGMKPTNADLDSLARYINSATGRGHLGNFEGAAENLSKVLYSPRLQKSRVDLMNPLYYKSLSKPARVVALRDMGTLLGANASLLGLAAAGGADVGLDPTDKTFGKIRVGGPESKTWVDVGGAGFTPWLQLMARLALRQKNGKKLDEKEISQVLVQFARTRLAPVPGVAADVYAGKKVDGTPTTLTSETIGLVTPMDLKDIYEAYAGSSPRTAAAVALPAVHGAGVTTYDE